MGLYGVVLSQIINSRPFCVVVFTCWPTIYNPAFESLFLIWNGLLFIIWLSTTPYNPRQQHTTPYNTIQHHTTPHNTIQNHTTPYNTIQHHTTPYNTIQLHPTPYNTIQHHTNTQA